MPLKSNKTNGETLKQYKSKKSIGSDDGGVLAMGNSAWKAANKAASPEAEAEVTRKRSVAAISTSPEAEVTRKRSVATVSTSASASPPIPVATTATPTLGGLPVEVLTLIVGYCAGLNYTKRPKTKYDHLTRSYVVDPVAGHYWSLNQGQCGSGANVYVNFLQPLALVHGPLCTAVQNVMLEDARSAIPSQEWLIDLKARASALDLNYLRESFVEAMTIRHGQTYVEMDGGDATNLDAFKEVMGMDEAGIFKAVIRAYKMFLVVKAVEWNWRGEEAKGCIDWSKKANAPHIIDLMWHAHILHTKTYASDCALLLGVDGELVHHEPAYWMPQELKGVACFERKVKALFKHQLSQAVVDEEVGIGLILFGINTPQDLHLHVEQLFMDDEGCG